MATDPSLLIVEKDADLLDLLVRNFTRRGYSVTGVRHPRQALAAANVCQYRVAVVDYTLHETDGIRLMKMLQRTTADLSVVMLSDRPESVLRDEALEGGARNYLSRSCPFAELEDAVESAMDESPCADSPSETGQR